MNENLTKSLIKDIKVGKKSDETFTLHWSLATQKKKDERAKEWSFSEPYKLGNSRYFYKEKIEVPTKLVSKKMSQANQDIESGSLSVTFSADVIEGAVKIKYQMYSIPDELKAVDDKGNSITGTDGKVKSNGSLSGELNNTKSVTVNVNVGKEDPNSVFKFKIIISDYSEGKTEKMYTGDKGALRKAKNRGFKKVKNEK